VVRTQLLSPPASVDVVVCHGSANGVYDDPVT
jgi:hypothetical protein